MITWKGKINLLVVILVISVSGCGLLNSKKQLSDCKSDVSEFESKIVKMDNDFNETYTKLTDLSVEIKSNPSKASELKMILEECKLKAQNAHMSISHTDISSRLPDELAKYMNTAKERIAAYFFARKKFAENILNSMNGINEQYSINEKLLQEAEAFRIQGGLAMAQAKVMVGLN